MRRRPEEDDRERVERVPGEATGGRRPADERWNRAGNSTDDDVLRRQRLQPQRVNEDVAKQPAQRERRGHEVHGRCEQGDRAHRERDPEREPAARLDPAGDQGPVAGPRHARVAVAVDEVVDRPGAARREVAAQHGPEDGGEARPGRVGDEHRRHRRDQQQDDDPGLGQREVVAQDVQQPPPPGGRRERDGRPLRALDRGCSDQLRCLALHQTVTACVSAAPPASSACFARAASGTGISVAAAYTTVPHRIVASVRWPTISPGCLPSHTLIAPSRI